MRATAALVGAAALAGASGQADAPLTHEYAEANGVRRHSARAGRGRLVMFLHGFPE